MPRRSTRLVPTGLLSTFATIKVIADTMSMIIAVAMAVTTGAGELVTGRLFDTLGSGAAWAFTLGVDAAALVLCLYLARRDRRRYPGLYEGEA